MFLDFKTIEDVMVAFPSDIKAREYLSKIRWGSRQECPFCGSDSFYKLVGFKTYKCKNKSCLKIYSVVSGTVFENSHLSMDKWLIAAWLIRHRASTHNIAKILSITQKSAWRVSDIINDSIFFLFKGADNVKKDIRRSLVIEDELLMLHEQRRQWMKQKEEYEEKISILENKPQKNSPLPLHRVDHREGQSVSVSDTKTVATILKMDELARKNQNDIKVMRLAFDAEKKELEAKNKITRFGRPLPVYSNSSPYGIADDLRKNPESYGTNHSPI